MLLPRLLCCARSTGKGESTCHPICTLKLGKSRDTYPANAQKGFGNITLIV